jgi:hypothetical protein
LDTAISSGSVAIHLPAQQTACVPWLIRVPNPQPEQQSLPLATSATSPVF